MGFRESLWFASSMDFLALPGGEKRCMGDDGDGSSRWGLCYKFMGSGLKWYEHGTRQRTSVGKGHQAGRTLHSLAILLFLDSDEENRETRRDDDDRHTCPSYAGVAFEQ